MTVEISYKWTSVWSLQFFPLCVKVCPICVQDPPRKPTHRCTGTDRWLTSVPGSWYQRQECAFLCTETGFGEVSCFLSLFPKKVFALLLQLLHMTGNNSSVFILCDLSSFTLSDLQLFLKCQSLLRDYGQVFSKERICLHHCRTGKLFSKH